MDENEDEDEVNLSGCDGDSFGGDDSMIFHTRRIPYYEHSNGFLLKMNNGTWNHLQQI